MVSSMAVLGSWVQPTVGYQGVALIMLMGVSLLAMFFEILPVLVSAVLSAVVWNFFFIPPVLTFTIHNTEDLFLFLMYFIIAMVNAVLTLKIRERNKRIREEEAREKTIILYDSILNSLSHELRTPVSTILGVVDVLRHDNGHLSKDQQAELLEEMNKASLRLNHQVENLLGLSRLESGMVRLRPDWTDINEIVYKVVSMFNESGPKQNLKVIPGEHLPLFKLDPIVIEQVLFNLIQNAIMYTPETATITISTDYINEKCVITVADNGPGFPSSTIANVFDKFYRISKNNPMGTGLGLSIVKGFVEAHSGTIELKNNSTGGAHFRIEIPALTSFIQYLKNE